MSILQPIITSPPGHTGHRRSRPSTPTTLCLRATGVSVSARHRGNSLPSDRPDDRADTSAGFTFVFLIAACLAVAAVWPSGAILAPGQRAWLSAPPPLGATPSPVPSARPWITKTRATGHACSVSPPCSSRQLCWHLAPMPFLPIGRCKNSVTRPGRAVSSPTLPRELERRLSSAPTKTATNKATTATIAIHKGGIIVRLAQHQSTRTSPGRPGPGPSTAHPAAEWRIWLLVGGLLLTLPCLCDRRDGGPVPPGLQLTNFVTSRHEPR